MFDPISPRRREDVISGRAQRRNPSSPGGEPNYSALPGFDSSKGGFFGDSSVAGKNFWGTRIGDGLQDDLDQQSALQAETEAERTRTDAHVNAYKLAAERRGSSAYMTQSGKSPVSNTMAQVGKAVGGAAISALTGKAVMAGFALI